MTVETGSIVRTQMLIHMAQVKVPVWIVQSEADEFIKPEHAPYLSLAIPDTRLIFLQGVTHFAPLQRPERFNRLLTTFLDTTRHEPE